MTNAFKTLLTAAAFACLAQFASAEDDLNVLPEKIDGKSPASLVSEAHRKAVFAALDKREKAFEAVKTPEQCEAWQQRLKAGFAERLGEFPERTPLNARIVGQEKGDACVVEKIILESQPRHYLTANLYLPNSGKGPWPVVIIPCGHTSNGKAATGYQRVAMILARHGIAACCYDPIGQGERYQILDESGKPRFNATTEHTLAGVGSILVGRNTATYRVWDGMRVIDYLQSRDDIDGEKIGCTGDSGGGTLTSYLMTLDDRIVAAAPTCYITSWRRLVETIGPQDAEQNVFGILDLGLDHADYLCIRAPRPTLVNVSTQDFFDIDGSWFSFRQAKRFYSRLEYPERVEIVESDTKHGFSRVQRQAMCAWMLRWLAGRAVEVRETDETYFPAAQLVCTSEGQTMQLPAARSVFELNAEYEARLRPAREKLWKETPLEESLAKVRELARIREADKIPALKRGDRIGEIGRENAPYRIDLLDLWTEDGVPLPALAFVPEKHTSEAVLYLHADGKAAQAGPDGEIAKLANAGKLVLAVDIRGTGETGRSGRGTWYESFGANSTDFFLSYLVGQSYVGQRAEDVLRAAAFARGYSLAEGQKPRTLTVISHGDVGPAALHAVALDPVPAKELVLRNSLATWRDVIHTPVSSKQLPNVVHGALRVYDLPDLVSAAKVRGTTVRIESPVNARGE